MSKEIACQAEIKKVGRDGSKGTIDREQKKGVIENIRDRKTSFGIVEREQKSELYKDFFMIYLLFFIAIKKMDAEAVADDIIETAKNEENFKDDMGIERSDIKRH